MTYVTARDGTQLYTEDTGVGHPVVLVHGWPLSSASWEYQTTELPRAGLRCITYDRRGFGRSDKPYRGYDYDTLADDLASVVDAITARDPSARVSLVGFSMGGGEVVRYMARHGSHKVSRAVLIGAVTPFLLKTDDNPSGVDRAVFSDMQAGIRADRPAFLAKFLRGFFGADRPGAAVSDELIAWAHSLALVASPQATLECITAFGTTDFRSDCRKMDVPTWIAHGDADAIVPHELSAVMTAKLIDGAKLELFPGGSHGLFYTERRRLNEGLVSFLRTA